jgi:hypothetical protein
MQDEEKKIKKTVGGWKNTVKQRRFMQCDVPADSHSVLNACKKLRIVNSQTYTGGTEPETS